MLFSCSSLRCFVYLINHSAAMSGNFSCFPHSPDDVGCVWNKSRQEVNKPTSPSLFIRGPNQGHLLSLCLWGWPFVIGDRFLLCQHISERKQCFHHPFSVAVINRHHVFSFGPGFDAINISPPPLTTNNHTNSRINHRFKSPKTKPGSQLM